MTLDEKLDMLRLMTEEAKERLEDLSELLQMNLENATELASEDREIHKQIVFTAGILADVNILQENFP